MKNKFIAILALVCMLINLVAPCYAAGNTPDIIEILDENFDSYTPGFSVSGQGGWTIENESLKGNLSWINSNPDGVDTDDNVLDSEIVKDRDTSKNKYAKLNIKKSTGNKKYLMFTHKVRFSDGVVSSVFYAGGKFVKGDTNASKYILQITYDVKNKQLIQATAGGNVTIAENVEYPLNKWMDMKYVLNVDTNTFDAYIDSTKVNATAIPAYFNDEGYKIGEVTYINIGSIRWNNTPAHIYTDDIKIYAFDNIEYATLDARLVKMKNALESEGFSGQNNLTESFEPNIPYLEGSDTVDIISDDDSVYYDKAQNIVVVNRTTEDKTVALEVTVTTENGESFTKILEFFIPGKYDDNFDESEYDVLTQGEYISNTNNGFYVEQTDDTISISSQSAVYYSADDYDTSKFISDLERINIGHSKAVMSPSNGLNYQFAEGVIVPLEQSGITASEASENNKPLFDIYDFAGPNMSATYYAGNVKGKNAMAQFTYINKDRYQDASRSAETTNEVKFQVDKGLFTAKDNKLTIEVEYYTEDDGQYSILYPAKDNAQGEIKFGTSSAPLKKGEWTVAKFNVTDADFTHYINTQGMSMMIKANKNGKKIYYHKISVYASADSDYVSGKSVTTAFSDYPVTTPLRVSFGMELPDENGYNGTGSKVAAEILDFYGNTIATVVLAAQQDQDTVYALYGNEDKVVIYQGDIKGRKLYYNIDVNPTGNTFSVNISDGENWLGWAKDLDISNESLYSGTCNCAYLKISHGSLTNAVKTVFDNIVIYNKSDEDAKKCAVEMLNLQLDEMSVINDFVLPDTGETYDDVTISWQAQKHQSYIKIDSNVAYVYPDGESHDVVLTATIECGEFSLSKEFNVTVKSAVGLFAQAGEIEETSDGNVVNASVSVKYAGSAKNFGGTFKPFDISFVAVSKNPANGKILDRKVDVKRAVNPYSTLEFSIQGLQNADGNVVEYYLWDDNFMPVTNNAPTEISNIKAKNNNHSIAVIWDECFDDNNSPVYYKIYRDGKLICNSPIDAVDGKVTYRDTSMTVWDNKNYTYKVVAVDSNGIETEVSTSVSGHTCGMPATFRVNGTSINDFSQNGVNIITGKTDVNEAYFEFTKIGGSPCIFTPFPTGTTRAYYTPTFYTDKSKVSSNDRNVVAEVTYFDKGTGTMNCIYWSTTERRVSEDVITLTNTNTWKVAVFTMKDANFIESEKFSRGDFGFYSTNSSLYISKVEISKAEEY